jgi:hypothetical protein
VSPGASRAQRAARRLTLIVLAVAALAGGPAAQAWGANLFTLDPQADSIGPIVVDGAGNSYVARLHKAVPNDTTMFCKFPPGARSCAHPIALGNTTNANSVLNSPSQPFPVLDPTGGVWVVENRYVPNDTVIWKSFDRGASFSGPDDIGTGCYSNLGTPDDVLWYENSVGFVSASYNAGLGYGYSVFGETCAGPGATPGTGPGQGATGWAFENPGSGDVVGAALAFAPNEDQVEAYWLLNNPPNVEFFRYSRPNLPPGTPGDFAATLPSNWVGPTKVTDGYMPRLAGGPAGLFMLSEDQTAAPNLSPSTLDVRKYDTTNHNFGAPKTVQDFAQSETGLFDGGDLSQNAATGELAAVWPVSSNGTSLLRAYFSINGGASFSTGEDVATIGSGYAIYNSARVGIAANGLGFATFQDNEGLHVVDLTPVAAQFKVLSARGGAVSMPATCPLPRGSCGVLVSLTLGAGKASAAATHHHGSTKLAGGSFTVAAGATKKLRVRLSAAGRSALRSHHGRLNAKLTLTLRTPSWSHTTTGLVTLRG